jgi:alkanesulfonate monooxygenase SsuD/methylene tetrahydromethanopterin reductase-like flavin-dependent oxidoreductase (luciferase family)
VTVLSEAIDIIRGIGTPPGPDWSAWTLSTTASAAPSAFGNRPRHLYLATVDPRMRELADRKADGCIKRGL